MTDIVGVDLSGQNNDRNTQATGGDLLDAAVAAVDDTCCAQDSHLVHHPRPDEMPLARLEGWICAITPHARVRTSRNT